MTPEVTLSSFGFLREISYVSHTRRWHVTLESQLRDHWYLHCHVPETLVRLLFQAILPQSGYLSRPVCFSVSQLKFQDSLSQWKEECDFILHFSAQLKTLELLVETPLPESQVPWEESPVEKQNRARAG